MFHKHPQLGGLINDNLPERVVRTTNTLDCSSIIPVLGLVLGATDDIYSVETDEILEVS